MASTPIFKLRTKFLSKKGPLRWGGGWVCKALWTQSIKSDNFFSNLPFPKTLLQRFTYLVGSLMSSTAQPTDKLSRNGATFGCTNKKIFCKGKSWSESCKWPLFSFYTAIRRELFIVQSARMLPIEIKYGPSLFVHPAMPIILQNFVIFSTPSFWHFCL